MVVAGRHLRAERFPRTLRERDPHRHATHRLDTGRNYDVVDTGHDALGREVGGLLTRSTLPVDGDSWHRFGPSGTECRVPSDVERLLADLGDAPHDHVVDQDGVEVVAFGESRQCLGCQVDRMPLSESSVPLPHRCSNGVNDHSSFHGILRRWRARVLRKRTLVHWRRARSEKQGTPVVLCAASSSERSCFVKGAQRPFCERSEFVETIGLEPTTPWLQTRCSPN